MFTILMLKCAIRGMHAFRSKALFSNLHIWYYLVVKILCIIIMKSVSGA